jgi:hypothetical protein
MALAFVVLKQSFANDPVVNDPPERKLENASERLLIPALFISFFKSKLVGTLKPTGQISLAPLSFQACALFEPSSSTF